MSELKFYWSREPGKFLQKDTGTVQIGGTFTGTVREWYETLVEVMIDLGLTIQRARQGRPLRYLSWRGDANVVTIVECSVLHRPLEEKEIGTIGEGRKGIICNIPIQSDVKLYNSGRLELIQFEGADEERILGQIQVVDAIIRL